MSQSPGLLAIDSHAGSIRLDGPTWRAMIRDDELVTGMRRIWHHIVRERLAIPDSAWVGLYDRNGLISLFGGKGNTSVLGGTGVIVALRNSSSLPYVRAGQRPPFLSPMYFHIKRAEHKGRLAFVLAEGA